MIAQIDRAEFLQKVKEIEAKLAQAKAAADEIEAGTRSEDIRQAEESVKQAKSRYDNAKAQRERMEALYSRQIISRKDFDNADTECAVCEAQLSANQEKLKQLKEGARPEVREGSRAKVKEIEAILAQEQIRLQNTQIVAPFAGEIVRRNVDSGALVSPSTPVVTLIHLETLKAVANVLEKDVGLIKLGMKAKILTEAYPGKPFEGTVVRINKALDLATRTLQAEINIPNPGSFAEAGDVRKDRDGPERKTGRTHGSKGRCAEGGGKEFVFAVEGNQALRKPVVTGIEQETLIEIVEGVKEGDKIVVRGQESLKDRSTVRIIEGS